MKREKRRFDEETKRRAVLLVFDWVGTLVVSLTVLSLLLSYVFRVVGVDGESMLPTLKHRDLLLLSSFQTDYDRGDIIVIDRYTQEPLIKRVIAVSGDTIVIDTDGLVWINGHILKETYIQGETARNDFSGEVKIPSGYLFVMGDNRTVSKDSRMQEVGLVSEKDVVGKAICRVWPLTSVGFMG